MSVTQSTPRINKTELNSYFPKTLKLIEEKQKLYFLKELAGKFSISEFFGGCTGYGCGAAFNFMTLLSDGEVHACRKMPSLIGNIHMESLDDIYDSAIAEKYRLGTSACAHCSIRPVCGGCSAVALSHGFDIFNEKDPMCFIDSDI